MNRSDQIRDRRPPLSSAQKYERIAFYLLLAWCLLPAIMSICSPVCAVLGLYPPMEVILPSVKINQANSGMHYILDTMIYRWLVYILGAITYCFAAWVMSVGRKKIFRMESVKKAPWVYLLMLLLLWSVVCTAASDYYYYSIIGQTQYLDGLVTYFICAGVFLCACMIRKETWRKTLIRTFVGVITWLALIMVVQQKTDNPYLLYVFPAPRATVFNQFNHFGYMLSMAALGFAGFYLYDRAGNKSLRWLYAAGVLFILYALVINDTFGAQLAVILALPVAYVFYLASGRKADRRALTMLAVVFLAVVLICVVIPSVREMLLGNFSQLKQDIVIILTDPDAADKAGTNRLGLWRATWKAVMRRPILGVGPDGLTGEYSIGTYQHPHNEYLQTAAFLGVPGLLLYLSALISLACHQWKRIKELDPMVLTAAGVSVAYLISALFGNTLFNTMPYLWMFLGFTAAAREADEPLFWPETGPRSERDKIAPLIMTGFVLFGLLLPIVALRSYTVERQKELEDLKTMRAAEIRTRESIDPASLKTDEYTYYWYSKRGDKLIPTNQLPPAPYGVGTDKAADGSKAFAADSGVAYPYDDAADYTHSVVAVAVMPDSDQGLNVRLAWIDRNS